MRGVQLAHSSVGLRTRIDSDRTKKQLRVFSGLRNSLRSSRLPYPVLLSFMALPLSSCSGTDGASDSSSYNPPSDNSESSIPCDKYSTIDKNSTSQEKYFYEMCSEYPSINPVPCDKNSTWCGNDWNPPNNRDPFKIVFNERKYECLHDGDIIELPDCTRVRLKSEILEKSNPEVYPVNIKAHVVVELLDDSGNVLASKSGDVESTFESNTDYTTGHKGGCEGCDLGKILKTPDGRSYFISVGSSYWKVFPHDEYCLPLMETLKITVTKECEETPSGLDSSGAGD